MEPKSLSRLKLAIIILIVSILLAALAIFAFLFMQSRTVDHYFQTGYDRYDSAFAKLDHSLDDLAKIKITKDSGNIGSAARKISRKIPPALTDLTEAERAFERMEKSSFIWWEKRAADFSNKSAKYAHEGAEELEAEMKEIDKMNKMIKNVEIASNKFNEAFEKANEAITRSNNNEFSEAKDSATAADLLFSEADALLSEADKQVPDAGVDSILPALAMGRRWTASVTKMADAGNEKKIEEYNKLARENNLLGNKVAKAARKRVLADPGGWFGARIDTLNEEVAVHFRKADLWREKALKIWRKNI